jgi:capsule biosynthesis phosphatase
MKICIDVDGVLCELRRPEQTYAEVEPKPGAIQKMKSLKQAGHYLILCTARHMATCNSNIGMVTARQGKTLLDWLAQHEIPYDELWFGKPHADVYIDDNAYRFSSWPEISDDGSNLPVSREKLASQSRPSATTSP